MHFLHWLEALRAQASSPVDISFRDVARSSPGRHRSPSGFNARKDIAFSVFQQEPSPINNHSNPLKTCYEDIRSWRLSTPCYLSTDVPACLKQTRRYHLRRSQRSYCQSISGFRHLGHYRTPRLRYVGKHHMPLGQQNNRICHLLPAHCAGKGKLDGQNCIKWHCCGEWGSELQTSTKFGNALGLLHLDPVRIGIESTSKSGSSEGNQCSAELNSRC